MFVLPTQTYFKFQPKTANPTPGPKANSKRTAYTPSSCRLPPLEQGEGAPNGPGMPDMPDMLQFPPAPRLRLLRSLGFRVGVRFRGVLFRCLRFRFRGSGTSGSLVSDSGLSFRQSANIMLPLFWERVFWLLKLSDEGSGVVGG